MTDIMDIQAQLQEKWLIFWWALGIGTLTVGIAWLRGFFNPFKISSLPIIHGEDVFKGFALFLFIEILLIPLLAGFAFGLLGWNTNLKPDLQGWLNILMVLGGFAAVFLAYRTLTVTQRKQLWEQTGGFWLDHAGLGIASWFVFFPIVLAFNQLMTIFMWHLFHHSFVEQSVVISLRQALANPALFGVTALAIVTLVPFTEEFLFRGLLQNWLKRKFGRAWAAVALSSFIFAIFHYTSAQGVANIELLSSLFLLSCVLGYIYERQRSLWAPIGLHSFFNLMSLLMIFKE